MLLRRAIATRNMHLVRTAAAECRRVPLDDALAIALLIAEREPVRYPRAAARWLGRLCLEHDVGIADVDAVAEPLARLAEPGERDDAIDQLRAALGALGAIRAAAACSVA